MMRDSARLTALGRALRTRRSAKAAELIGIFGVAFLIVWAGSPWVDGDPLRRQAVAWVANLAMLGWVWAGLRLRGQGCADIGLPFRFGSRRAILRGAWQSVLVFTVAVVAFGLGAVLMQNIVGQPDGPDFSGYDYLRDNLIVFLGALASVYFISSFGEEVIYRGFLVNRIAELGGQTRAAWCVAVVLSAVVFGYVHSPWGLAGMIQTGCMGLALGICYLAVRRNLWVNVLAHVYLDTLLLAPIYFGGTQPE